MAISLLVRTGLVLFTIARAHSDAQNAQSADDLVRELRQFQAALPAVARSDGSKDPIEERRHAIYDRLWTLGSEAIPALNRGLANPDVQIRRNVALFLGVAGDTWYDRSRQRLDIRPCLKPLITALSDTDDRVRQLAAQAVGAIGSEAAPAVPALITLLSSVDEGSRNTALIGLKKIGPAAREALPAIRQALNDPSADVRRFAQLAIAAIEK
jgi:HEAT repeat protein